MSEFVQPIAQKFNFKIQQVEAVLSLLEEGATIPFIARYRKDRTGALDEVQIQQIQEESKFLKEFLSPFFFEIRPRINDETINKT